MTFLRPSARERVLCLFFFTTLVSSKNSNNDYAFPIKISLVHNKLLFYDDNNKAMRTYGARIFVSSYTYSTGQCTNASRRFWHTRKYNSCRYYIIYRNVGVSATRRQTGTEENVYLELQIIEYFL